MIDYVQYKLQIRYENYDSYEKYDQDIQDILETKYGKLGATHIQQCYVSPSIRLLLVTSFEAPDGILSDLKSVKLGEGIATDIQLEEYRRR
ncbi:uncharacterized protein EURHEDRAFT_381255 [Aspergillus ruber CBS 135680]|uniref:Uncharacterized protein n=1 Tax=Aspergillus ruber (strain CBS 135680) TaxID=1388766 RepID=A0A017S4U7_ASPRC|nr:uncharacterized protein EURHEDRAFT_381255 [Aspergillus ruber CBS 135680]EYE91205.1 hypothetical protein EURHEDRAFT_381255 [Aspergillus ruber CBS 135680]